MCFKGPGAYRANGDAVRQPGTRHTLAQLAVLFFLQYLRRKLSAGLLTRLCKSHDCLLVVLGEQGTTTRTHSNAPSASWLSSLLTTSDTNDSETINAVRQAGARGTQPNMPFIQETRRKFVAT